MFNYFCAQRNRKQVFQSFSIARKDVPEHSPSQIHSFFYFHFFFTSTAWHASKSSSFISATFPSFVSDSSYSSSYYAWNRTSSFQLKWIVFISSLIHTPARVLQRSIIYATITMCTFRNTSITVNQQKDIIKTNWLVENIPFHCVENRKIHRRTTCTHTKFIEKIW